MTEAEKMVFDSMLKTLFINEQSFKELIAGCVLSPEYSDGVLWGVGLTKGAEFHFVSNGTHPITREIIRKYLQPLIDQYGFACTKVPKKDTRQARFNRLLGFEQSGEDALDIHFKITKLKERKSCQL